MKLVNFASLDPSQKARDISGLKNTSKLDRDVWNEIFSDWEKLAYESQKTFLKIQEKEVSDRFIEAEGVVSAIEDTEVERTVRARLVQGFFRESVLANYRRRCSFCRFEVQEMLNASHIIPWKDNVERRADPTNGLCLCVFHDRAFDRGIMAINANMKIMISPRVKNFEDTTLFRIGILEMEGNPIMLPEKFLPDTKAIDFHRSKIFLT